MTNEDLKTMQAWPLERKIRVSQLRIMEWYQHWGGKVYVSFSGGKDSTVLLDLARRVYPNIEAVFADTGLEYPEVRKFALSHSNVTKIKPEKRFDEVLTEKGYPIGSKKVARMIRTCQNPTDKNEASVRLYQTGIKKDGTKSKNFKLAKKWLKFIDSEYRTSEECCDIMKKYPLKNFGKATGKKPIIGTMAEDSAFRKINWLKTGCNVFDTDDPQCKPLSFWGEQDILRYLKLTGTPYCSVYGNIVKVDGKLATTGEKHTGCIFCLFGVEREKEPNRFQKLKKIDRPKYNYCIGGGEFDQYGKLIPNKKGLGEGKILDFMGVPY
ncbi:phosphoadenosine phosphosulfate reductase family protein [Eubacterium sp. 1001713B170207_170306_E7]|uniref:phosphoadenosine phosphosulfate reductase family protein n=1 Tax=Eubacterium sp. 1001713B170207_170306_E7 TaxID=2787097 RepID=UPI001FAB6FAF|nr:phosphoadenosine phosphosulfate reductase family protein [Eubacterium sp. 1001713B170207_170306_E7]